MYRQRHRSEQERTVSHVVADEASIFNKKLFSVIEDVLPERSLGEDGRIRPGVTTQLPIIKLGRNTTSGARAMAMMQARMMGSTDPARLAEQCLAGAVSTPLASCAFERWVSGAARPKSADGESEQRRRRMWRRE